MTTALLGRPQTFGDTLRALSGSGAADLVHVGFPIGGEGYDFADFAGQASRFARDTGVPIAVSVNQDWVAQAFQDQGVPTFWSERAAMRGLALLAEQAGDRKSTRLNSSHLVISYAVFCLNKKKTEEVAQSALRCYHIVRNDVDPDYIFQICQHPVLQSPPRHIRKNCLLHALFRHAYVIMN